MNEKQHTEMLVGIFLLIGIIAITFLALRIGDFQLLNNQQYIIKAEFTSASGLKKGAHVEIAGVSVGKVTNIIFNPETYLAEVHIAIENSIQIPDDSIASIRTSGIIGDKFLKISPGGSDNIIEPNMIILETEPSINLEELISKYIFESGK
ncbi:MAG: outer membrane lipid asymmetry maintenance protein MlaD [Legionellales bacterium]|jgi:phospholipid/cholesterol/gamma-HCH transport system substrate-binding protein|nr:outer membrane lipid asymmetry maintenance protein MlaD [Legionellales bacterium]HBH10728.1 outer membrane lipid asymmetry maintenance protein MlaD [Gammaproteobacteria bacterium]|tara:strand:- start:702 stop:1154 length:453 start_codon:yes stop_codon:yes gene_type:complete